MTRVQASGSSWASRRLANRRSLTCWLDSSNGACTFAVASSIVGHLAAGSIMMTSARVRPVDFSIFATGFRRTSPTSTARKGSPPSFKTISMEKMWRRGCNELRLDLDTSWCYDHLSRRCVSEKRNDDSSAARSPTEMVPSPLKNLINNSRRSQRLVCGLIPQLKHRMRPCSTSFVVNQRRSWIAYSSDALAELKNFPGNLLMKRGLSYALCHSRMNSAPLCWFRIATRGRQIFL